MDAKVRIIFGFQDTQVLIRHFLMEAYPELDIYPSGSQVIGDSVLYIVYGLEPGVGSYILHLEQVENLGADPGIFRKTKKMF